MKFKQLMIICTILLLSFSVVTANELYISDVTGLAGGNIPTDGSTVTFTIGLNNTGPGNITGYTNGFRIYSPTGAEWTTTDGAFTGAITTAMINTTFINSFSIDGAGEDTVGFAGFRIVEPGIPVGDIPAVWTITIGPVDPIYNDGQICIDSSFYRPAGAWMWPTTDGDVQPVWGGPYCYTIGLPKPTIDPIEDFTALADCDDILITVVATAPEGETLLPLTTNILPAGAAFNDVTNEFTWSPTAADVAGSPYTVTFTATSVESGLSSSEDVIISVVLNQNPVVSAAGPFEVKESNLLTFLIDATDPEGRALTYSTSDIDMPATATLDPNTGDFDWTPTFADLEIYVITFDVTDDCGGSASIDVTIEVVENAAPVFTIINPIEVVECGSVGFTVSATDPDGDDALITYALNNPPATSTFDVNTGEFSWVSADLVGLNNLDFVATDEFGKTANMIVAVTVSANQPPDMSPIADDNVMACQNITFTAVAPDPEGTVVTFGITGLPNTATFSTLTGVFDWTPDATDIQGGGIYNMTITATDECGKVASDNFTITVTPDGVPEFTTIPSGTETVQSCEPLSIPIVASDPQGTDLVITYSGIPEGAIITPGANGVVTLTWTPTQADIATYQVTFTATDDCQTSTDGIFNIDVVQDDVPTITAIGNKTITACETLEFTIVGGDPEGKDVEFRMTSVPPIANAITNTEGTSNAVFRWTPTAGDVAGSPYTVDIIATDECGSEATEVITITVNANTAPVYVAPIADVTVQTCDTIKFTFTATDDLDNNLVTFAKGLNFPPTAILTNDGNGVGTFYWETTSGDVTVLGVEIIANDNCANSTTEAFDITINPDNDPVLTAIGPHTIKACKLLDFTVVANDDDDATNALVSITAAPLPGDASFTDDGGGLGSFSWSPAPADTLGSPYTITFTVTDGCGSIVTEPVVITVNADDAPVLEPISDETVVACQTLVIDFTTTITDGETVTFFPPTSAYEPVALTFTDNLNGTAKLELTPAVGDTGVHEIYFEIVDDCGSIDSQTVTITVTPDVAPDLAVTLENIPDSVVEGAIVTFIFSALDSVNTNELMTFGLSGAPETATISEPTNNTVDFTWETISGDAGDVSFWLLATDECGTSDSEQVSITVVANSAPVFNEADIQAQIPASPQQGDSIIIDIVITDDNIPASGKKTSKSNSLSGNTDIEIWADTASIPDDVSKWSLTDNGDGTAKFIWATDSLTPAGDFTITFYASDGVDQVSFGAVVGIITSVAVLDGSGLPENFYLSQNYPNPFNPETEIEFGVPERSYVSLAVYNVLGQKIKTLVDEVLSANRYTAYWDGSNDNNLRVASGIYFYKLETTQYQETKKMIMIK